MFGWLKKNPEPQPDPEAEKKAAKLKEQQEIAELQSQLNHQRGIRDRAVDKQARLEEERKEQMARIRAEKNPAAQKRIATMVGEIDEELHNLDEELTLARKNIKNIRKVLQQKYNLTIADEGNVGKVVNLKNHAAQLRKAGEEVGQTGIELESADDANGLLLDGYQDSTGAAAVNDIIKEALGQVESAESEASPAEAAAGREMRRAQLPY